MLGPDLWIGFIAFLRCLDVAYESMLPVVVPLFYLFLCPTCLSPDTLTISSLLGAAVLHGTAGHLQPELGHHGRSQGNNFGSSPD